MVGAVSKLLSLPLAILDDCADFSSRLSELLQATAVDVGREWEAGHLGEP